MNELSYRLTPLVMMVGVNRFAVWPGHLGWYHCQLQRQSIYFALKNIYLTIDIKVIYNISFGFYELSMKFSDVKSYSRNDVRLSVDFQGLSLEKL